VTFGAAAIALASRGMGCQPTVASAGPLEVRDPALKLRAWMVSPSLPSASITSAATPRMWPR